MGKPSPKPRIAYNDDLVGVICHRIALGDSLVKITSEPGMPAYQTVLDWLQRHEEFAGKYARACADRAERYADEIVEISDTEPDPNRARVRVDARKWVAAKLKPKKYGDRVAVDASVEVTVLTPEQRRSKIDELMAKLKQ